MSGMSEGAQKDPLHGKTLKAMLTELVDRYGWEELSARIRIKCFAVDPSLDSSLKFLRRTPWARAKVEAVYLESGGHPAPRPKRRAEGGAAAPARLPASERTRLNVWTGKPFTEGE